ncbi:MAG: hypothetical protein AAF732_22290, partial [Pseudomonadota bacterium]
MTISKDLFLAILAMDAYNRGYREGIEGLGGVGAYIGDAKIDDDKGDEEAKSLNFYAVAYEHPTYGKIVSYRGTDDYGLFSPTSDVWTGWIFGAGLTEGTQLPLARDFYNDVTGADPFEAGSSAVTLTGHSLGGGLAGHVASLTGTQALIFDHEPFAAATMVDWFAELYDRGVVDQDTALDIWNGITPLPDGMTLPDTSNIEAIYVEGEVLQPIRALASNAAYWFAPLPEAETYAADIEASTNYKQVLPGFGSPLDAIGRHSMSILVIEKFGIDTYGADSSWLSVFDDAYAALKDVAIGQAAGFSPKDTGGTGTEAEKAAGAIAYSALDEGTLIFGNTGIRAMFDDLEELGRIVERGGLPGNLGASVEGLTEAIVQFAGQMALQKVDYTNHTDINPQEGILFFSKDGEIVEPGENPDGSVRDETAEADILSLDLSKVLWNTSDNPQIDDPDRAVVVEGVNTILDDLFEQLAIDGNESEFLKMLQLLYGGPDPNGDPKEHVAARYIGRADFALINDLAEVRLADRSADEIAVSEDQSGLYVSADGDQKIYGNRDNNVLVASDGDDWLTGGLGKDILVGKRGDDVFVDAISEAYEPSSLPLPDNPHDDIYVGGVEFEYALTQFLERLLHGSQSDVLRYTVRSDIDDQDSLRALGVEVLDLSTTTIGNAEAVKITVRDRNTDRVSTDYTIHVDTIELSERAEEVRIQDSWLSTPTVLDLGSFVPGSRVSSSDWDAVSFQALSGGISMVNGATRALNGGNPALPSGTMSAASESISLIGSLIFEVPPNIETIIGGWRENNPLRVTGAEKVTLTDYDDVYWSTDFTSFGELVTGWPDREQALQFGEVNGGGGRDILFVTDPSYIGSGDSIGSPPAPGEADTRAVAQSEMRLTLDGGEGEDRVIALGGTGAITVGGAGRDFVFNTSYYGQLYGDSIDGQGGRDGDIFWYWPNTFIMDAEPDDILQMFGFPLLGGTNVLFGMAIGDGSLAQDWFFPFVFYGRTTGDQLLVYNALFDGFMIVEEYDFGGLRDEQYGVPSAGDLGMTFRIANAPDSIEISLFNALWGHIFTYIDVLWNLTKAIRWQPVDDPLVLDLDGDGIETVSTLHSGVHFDLDGDFFAEKTGWVGADDGFLVLDRNANGRIDDITEMFGAPGVSGFVELAELDDTGDGLITADDAAFASLQVWRDLDQDGVTDEGELFSLAELDIVSIDAVGETLDAVTPQGTTLREKGGFTRGDGSTGDVYEAVFETDPTDTIFRGESGHAVWLGDSAVNAKGFGSMPNLAIAISNDFELAQLVSDVGAAMTTPTLSDVMETATPVFGAWAQTLERTRELTPVLLNEDANGVVLVDRATYVEDAGGGFWIRESGASVLDAQGTPIARTTLEDVLDQATATGQTWQLEQAFSPTSRSEPL